MKPIRLLPILVILSVLTTGTVFSQDSLNVSCISTLKINWDDCTDILADGDYMYIASGWSGLLIYDMADPSCFTEVASLDLHRDITTLLQIQSVVYLPVPGEGVIMVDVGDPAQPEVLGQIPFTGSQTLEVNKYDDHLIVMYTMSQVSDSSQVLIYNVDNPQNINLLSTTGVNGTINSIRVARHGLFYRRNSRVGVIDLSDLEQPNVLGIDYDIGYVSYMFVFNDILYYYTGNRSIISIYSVNDDLSVNFDGSFSAYSSSSTRNLIVLHDTLAIHQTTDGIGITSFADPRHPHRLCDLPRTYDIRAMVGYQNTVIAGVNSNWKSLGLKELNLENPAEAYWTERVTHTGQIQDVWGMDRRVYIANGCDGVWIVDRADPEQPVYLGRLDIPGNTIGITGEGNTVYATNDEGVMYIIDVSEPDTPALVGQVTYPSSGTFFKPQIQNSILYVMFLSLQPWNNALLSYDLTDPESPQLLGVCNALDMGFDEDYSRFVVDGDIAYFSIRADGVYGFDISDPENITPLGLVYNRYRIGDFSVNSGLMIAETNSRVAAVLDMNAYPQYGYARVIDYLGAEFPISQIAQNSSAVITMDAGANLLVHRPVSQSENWAVTGSYDLPAGLSVVSTVMDENDWLLATTCSLLSMEYTGDAAPGFFNLLEPTDYDTLLLDHNQPVTFRWNQPPLADPNDEFTYSLYITVGRNHDAQTIQYHGLQDTSFTLSLLDTLQYLPEEGLYASEWEVSAWLGSEETRCLQPGRFRAHVTLPVGDQQTRSSELPEQFDIVSSWPNPFNSMVRVTLALPVRDDVKLQVFDITGREVFHRQYSQMEAGYREICWQPGGGLSSGVFFLKISQSTGAQAVSKVILVR